MLYFCFSARTALVCHCLKICAHTQEFQFLAFLLFNDFFASFFFLFAAERAAAQARFFAAADAPFCLGAQGRDLEGFLRDSTTLLRSSGRGLRSASGSCTAWRNTR